MTRSVRLRLAALMIAAAAVAALPAAAAEFTPEQRKAIEDIVHDYLIHHPAALIEALQNAEEKLNADAHDKAAHALDDHRSELYDDPATPSAGNPQGDVTIVEFFDYRCPYCKQVQPSLDKLIRADHGLRFVYKEFPVLGPVSVTAAHAALAARLQGKYEAFHDAMMASRGPITDDTVFQVADKVGLDLARLKRDMGSPEIDRAIKRNMALADSLGIHGTPGFVIGRHIVPGAVDLGDLQQLVAAARHREN